MNKILLVLCWMLLSCCVNANSVQVPYGETRLNENPRIKIIRSRVPNISAHGYDTFELFVWHDNRWEQIKLSNFHTIEGADCFVQDFEFYTNPFRIVRKKRFFGDGWLEAHPAEITVYELDAHNTPIIVKMIRHSAVCDVRTIHADIYFKGTK